MGNRTAGFTPGQIVTVLAGREAGGRFVVVRLDESFLYLADGRKRPVRSPKRKNPRHVKILSGRNASLPAGLLTDEAIGRALRMAEEEG